MTGTQYQKYAARTIPENLDTAEMAEHALHGMAGEIGEIHSLYQKLYQGHDLDRTHLKKEVGDLLWFVAEYCTAMHWDLDMVMCDNIYKLTKRYPDGFSTERSLNRAENDI